MSDKRQSWECTDPDNRQYGRQIDGKHFQFKKGRKGDSVDINLEEYKPEEIEETINTFGYTLYESGNGYTNIVEEYGDRADWITAECIYEIFFEPPVEL